MDRPEGAIPKRMTKKVKKVKRDRSLERYVGYDVDPEAVAGAILTKALLVRRGRLALSSGRDGRSPGGPGRVHRTH